MDIITLAKELRKYVVGAEGNVSQKLNNKEFIIKSSGAEFKNLKNEDTTLCDLIGKPLSGKKPSMEVDFHSFLYRNYENINFIAHTHPTNTLKIICTEEIYSFASDRIFPDQIIFNGEVSCMVPYAEPGAELCNKLADSLDNFIKNHNYFPKLILLQNHGIICAGSSVKECIYSTEICEKSADIFIGSKLLGGMNIIDASKTKKLFNNEHENYRKNLIK